MKLIITAGGPGTKLWPVSRVSAPKPFQKLIDGKSLFKINLETLLKTFDPGDLIISTKKMYKDFLGYEVKGIPAKNIIYEPDNLKDTGPAFIYAALKVAELYPDESVMMIQADCIRTPREKFINMIHSFASFLKKNPSRIITGGIKPRFPEMGSDYLKLGEEIDVIGESVFYDIAEFVLRLHDYEKTKKLIENYPVLVHTNHLACYPEQIMKLAKQYRPDWFDAFTAMKKSFGTPDEEKITDSIYSNLEGGQIERITEKAYMTNGAIVVLPFEWTDIGTWDSLSNYLEENTAGDALHANTDVISIDSEGSLIRAEGEKLVAVVGVKDLVIVDTKDALLVCPREKAGDVKRIVKELREKEKYKKYL